MHIGEEIRRRREEQGLTGVQLAEKAGMAPSAVSQIETGKRTPNSASVVKLAAALGCEVGDLYPKAPSQLAFLSGEEIPTFRREDLSEAELAHLDAFLRGEKPEPLIEDTDETITFRVYYVRLLEENDRLLQKVRDLEFQNASLEEQVANLRRDLEEVSGAG
jgi:transcriptional regulator with XRE-family HTH domain